MRKVILFFIEIIILQKYFCNFPLQIYQKETQTIWKIPNVRDNWIIYFSSSSGKDRATSCLYVDVVEGDRPVKFTFNLFYLEQDEDDEGEFYFHFKPTEVPSSVKSLEGKYVLEILDRKGDVWKGYGTTFIQVGI